MTASGMSKVCLMSRLWLPPSTSFIVTRLLSEATSCSNGLSTKVKSVYNVIEAGLVPLGKVETFCQGAYWYSRIVM